MVICAIVGCPNTSKRALGISFYRLPAVISHQGERAREFSQKRRDLWLARIHRRDLGAEKYPNTRVCGLHFVSGKLLHGITGEYNGYTVAIYDTGKPSQLFDEKNIDWAPSINLGHGSAPRLSPSTDRYDRAAREKKNKRIRRTEGEEISETMKAMLNTQTVLTATGTQTVY